VLLAGCGWLAGWAQSGPDLENLRARAEQADPDAQNELGNAYNEGQAGLKQDYAEALKWYRRAAGKGFALAQYNLGLAYELGHGVPADEQQAFRYYLQAAEQGYAAAQFNVGNMYANGRGTGRDLFEANLWFKQAAEKGIVEAQFNLGLSYDTGRGVKHDAMQAARWYKQAADRGYPRAQHNLGLLFEDGRGVAKNDTTAAGYYRAAAEQGFAAAQTNYGIMISEGRGGLTRDPAQAWMWLSLAVENGASPEARDALTRVLDAGQQAAATRLLAERRTGKGAVAAAGPPVSAGIVPGQQPAPTAVASARAGDLTVALEQARAANTQLSDANQRLELEKARLEQQLATGGDPGKLVEQLREQSRRLAQQVQTLLADREAAEREMMLLKTRVKDAQDDLARAQSNPATPAPPADGSRQGKQISELTAKLEQAAGALARLQAANQQLTESNARLRQEKEILTADATQANATAPAGGDQSAILANLQRDNARLNDEVKRSTRELLSLNSQLRSLRNQAARPAVPDSATAQQLAQLTAKVEQSDREAGQWRNESSRLAARVAELESQPKPVVDNSAADKLAAAQQSAVQLQQQVTALQTEKADLEKWSRSLEQTVNEKSAQADGANSSLAELKQKLAQMEPQIRDRDQSLASQEEAAKKMTADNKELSERLARAKEWLKTAAADTTELDGLRQKLAAAEQQAQKADQDRLSLAATVAGLELELREARKSADNSAALAHLEKQLADASQALERNGVTVAELTGANDRLEKELAAARQGSNETGTLRDELAKATAEAAALRARNEQLIRDGEEQATFMSSSRHNLNQALGRVKELEQQLAEATAARTRDGDDNRKREADLAEANATVEALNATIAELTGANDRLEKDLDNARKSTEAALAAQSQAVSAAQPDAYKMEISTLQAQVKDLESQIEDERNNSAREVSTLAAQLARTRETNKSLTEANRALLSAKQSEAPAVSQQDFDQLQAKVRELTAAGEELRRQNEKQTGNSQSQLGALAAEKTALQERLEAVGTQLVKAQQENEVLQRQNAEATAQMAGSQQAAEQAKANLAELQGRAADAEKASESHSATVAELTQANTRLELEREDMRRLVESYRADIARLTQNVRSAEQQRTAAERGAQQNIDAVTAQLAQLRRDLETVRTAQARQAEAGAAQDRDRVAVITQLRTENGALAARLNQAQNTLDQIASAARLGTPAATIASGGPTPTRPVVTAPAGAADTRFHTVADGDSLSRISMRYYGTPTRWQEIFNANRDVLQGSSALRVGMQLRIP